MTESSLIGTMRSTDQLVANRPTGRTSGRSIFQRIMGEARGWWKNKTAVELAALLGCEVRSAERYLAGDRTPDAEAVLVMLRSEHGVKLVEAAVADLPAEQRKRFWTDMAMAVVHEQTRATRDAMRE